MKSDLSTGKENSYFFPKPSLNYASVPKSYLGKSQIELEIEEINEKVFKNVLFRENQKPIILASLSKKDIFVCMPTGGGKSLTFQLPAIMSSGLTIVIMPLISLIQDQMHHLTNLKIKSIVLNAWKKNQIDSNPYQTIKEDRDLKILFITPEKISKSAKTENLMQWLYENKRIERFAIDEAHCVSQWGREFREDYLKLNTLRSKYPNVPIIALTGTATEKIRKDVVNVLKMRNPSFFLASFNRPNLFYEVRAKTSKVLEEIISLIKEKYHGKTGLIYCLSKKDCEKVSKGLKNAKIKAGFYHASVTDEKRNKTQAKWTQGLIEVLVATVAFGMGIDKKNVRFVIHYSFPKSIENYYQESGRAGRDGLRSDCIIYFSHSDKYRQDYLIVKNKRQDLNYHELYTVMKYCEDIYTCRRKIQLSYFGEEFDCEKCNFMCDNCKIQNQFIEKNCSDKAIEILRIIGNSPNGINTLIQFAAFLKGSQIKKNESIQKCEGFGIFNQLKIEEIEGIIRKMIYEDIIIEKSVKCSKKFKMTKLEPGPKSEDLIKGSLQLYVKILALGNEEKNLKKIEKKIDVLGSGNKIGVSLKISPIIELSPFKYASFSTNFLQNQSSSVKNSYIKPINAPSLHTFVPRIPYEKNIEIILDPSPPNYKKNIENILEPPPSNYEKNIEIIEDLSYPKIVEKAIKIESEESELFDELKSRLEIVRKRLARKNGVSEEEIMENSHLEVIAKTMSGDIDIEFLKEIMYFKEINTRDVERCETRKNHDELTDNCNKRSKLK